MVKNSRYVGASSRDIWGETIYAIENPENIVLFPRIFDRLTGVWQKSMDTGRADFWDLTTAEVVRIWAAKEKGDFVPPSFLSPPSPPDKLTPDIAADPATIAHFFFGPKKEKSLWPVLLIEKWLLVPADDGRWKKIPHFSFHLFFLDHKSEITSYSKSRKLRKLIFLFLLFFAVPINIHIGPTNLTLGMKRVPRLLIMQQPSFLFLPSLYENPKLCSCRHISC